MYEIPQKILSLYRRALGIYREEGFEALLKSIPGKLVLTGKDLYALLYLSRLRRAVKSEILLKKIQGNKMYIDLRNPRLSYPLIKYGVWEEDTTRWLKESLKEGMTVIDIGANIGYFALIEARMVGDKGKVYAIEPDPRNIRLLKKNIEINNFSHIIKVYSVAISDQNGTDKFYLAKSSNNNSMIALSGDYIEVDTFRLDDFLRENEIDKESIDLIRMDIEGYEAKAIEGMTETLKTNTRLKLFIEIHPQLIGMTGYSVKWILEKLDVMGFKLKQKGKNYIFEK